MTDFGMRVELFQDEGTIFLVQGPAVAGDAIPETSYDLGQLRDFVAIMGYWLDTARETRKRFGLTDGPLTSVDLETESGVNQVVVSLTNGSVNIRAKLNRQTQVFTYRSQSEFEIPWETCQAFCEAFITAFSVTMQPAA